MGYTEIQDLHLYLSYLFSMPITFKFILYLFYKAVVESHQESRDHGLVGEHKKLVVSAMPMIVSFKRN